VRIRRRRGRRRRRDGRRGRRGGAAIDHASRAIAKLRANGKPADRSIADDARQSRRATSVPAGQSNCTSRSARLNRVPERRGPMALHEIVVPSRSSPRPLGENEYPPEGGSSHAPRTLCTPFDPGIESGGGYVSFSSAADTPRGSPRGSRASARP
jgi:hypothetical protein